METPVVAAVGAPGVEVRGPLDGETLHILSPQAIIFLADLHRRFNTRRIELLGCRIARQAELDAGVRPDFLSETRTIRESNWTVAPVLADLQDRRVEITGPVDRKMMINALNSGVKCFMADFEDSNSPTWDNCIQGQINLRDAVDQSISYTHAKSGKHYELADETAVLLVRPRGLHLVEKHLWVDGDPISGALFDFGLFFFHNAQRLIANGTGPYFYLPKLESHLEARLWNDVFNFAQGRLGLPRGTIKATVLIETILAAFQMDEILYELREHSAGLNCGRWDYIFSFIKKFRNDPDCVLPDRAAVTMERHFLKSYVDLLIQTCHRRGAHAMGGMAAQIPIKNDPQANEEALEKVRQDKIREATAGHDGTWIAHPGLAPIALEAFDAVMKGPNQLDVLREDVRITPEDLLRVPGGEISEQGFRGNIRVGIQYLEAWLCGNGCVPLYHLMEDAATAEICRSQLWQWIRHRARLSDGTAITTELFDDSLCRELHRIRDEVGEKRCSAGKFELAAKLFGEMVKKPDFDEFLTLPAYEYLNQGTK